MWWDMHDRLNSGMPLITSIFRRLGHQRIIFVSPPGDRLLLMVSNVGIIKPCPCNLTYLAIYLDLVNFFLVFLLANKLGMMTFFFMTCQTRQFIPLW